MEALKVLALCLLAAIVYGIVHDQITARVCIEYFTVFHPPIFHTQSPTMLGIGWGIAATWWVGALFSVPMILVSRAGSRPTLRASEVLPSIVWLLVAMGVCAMLSGITGFLLARQGVLSTDWLPFSYPPTLRNRLIADWWAHTAPYAAAFVGGIALCVITYRKRRRTVAQ